MSTGIILASITRHTATTKATAEDTVATVDIIIPVTVTAVATATATVAKLDQQHYEKLFSLVGCTSRTYEL